MYAFVIADNRKCIACYACVAACTEAHRQAGLQAYPRLFVTHTPAGSMPIQCRHCEDASCALVCPVQAITHTGGAVQVNESLCIGCKLCALACPYGNILPGGTPVPGQAFFQANYAFQNTPFQPDPMFLREQSYQEQLSLLGWSVGQKTVAVKCDRCHFRAAGPACVGACPHKALILVEAPNGSAKPVFEHMKAVAALPVAPPPAAKETTV